MSEWKHAPSPLPSREPDQAQVQAASPQTLEAGVIALTQLLGEVKKRVENLDNLIVPEVRQNPT